MPYRTMKTTDLDEGFGHKAFDKATKAHTDTWNKFISLLEEEAEKIASEGNTVFSINSPRPFKLKEANKCLIPKGVEIIECYWDNIVHQYLYKCQLLSKKETQFLLKRKWYYLWLKQ